jgi:signal transduction histidine kinase
MRSEDASRNKAWRDLVAVIVATLIVGTLCVRFEVSETLLAWTRPHERFQLDEVPAVLLFVAVALAWHAWRRVGETRAELARRLAIEARLREALVANRELARRGVAMQEEERRNLARELHDELGQYLNAIKIDAVCLRDCPEAGAAEARRSAASIISVTDRLQLVVRDIVRRLRPPGLDELGLSAALENCIEGWRRRLPSIEISVAVAEDLGRLDEATNITLYRLVQEGLTNVAKHARADRVEILMEERPAASRAGSEVVLSMRDNGVGSAPSPPLSGWGLVGMRERVEALKGRFDVTSGHEGFGFVASLPVHRWS